MQKLITSGVGGKDQFTFRISQLRESPQFRDFKEQITFSNHGDDDLPDLWFDLGFVEFVKDNYSNPFYPLICTNLSGRIQRSLQRSPESFDARQSMSSFLAGAGGVLMVDGVVVEKPISDDQSKYINSLEIRLRSSEQDVKHKEAQVLSLQTKLDKQVITLPGWFD